MTIQQVRYVVEVARHGSFSEAAKSLFISQPSLSNAVRELETELGIQIFIRTSRGIELSADGQEFMGYAMLLMDRASAIMERYSGTHESEKLHFSASSQHYFFAERAFLDVLAACGGEHCDVRLRETSTTKIIEDVASHVSEVGVLFFSAANRRFVKKLIAENKLSFFHIITVNACALIRNAHPLAERKSVSFADLAPYPFIIYEQEGFATSIYGEEILPRFEPEHIVRCFDRSTVISVISSTNACNIGSGLLPPDRTNGVIAMPLDEDAEMDIIWICPEGAKLTEAAHIFIDGVKRYTHDWAPASERRD